MSAGEYMDKKLLVFLGLLGLSFVLVIIASVIPLSAPTDVLKLILLAVAVVANVLAFSSRYYLYLILPLFEQRKRDIVIADQSPYWLSSTSDSILQKVGDDFVATVYINIPLYRSATEMSDEDKLNFAQQVSRMVGISKEPTRFSTQLYVMNKDAYIQKLRDTITTVEEEEAKLVTGNAPANEIERVRGKAAMWRKMLDNVGRGSSLELSSYASLSAKGGKEFEAVSLVQQKARELMSGIGATFGVSPNVVLGNELLKFVEPEYLIPFSTISEQITKNIQEEVI